MRFAHAEDLEKLDPRMPYAPNFFYKMVPFINAPLEVDDDEFDWSWKAVSNSKDDSEEESERSLNVWRNLKRPLWQAWWSWRRSTALSSTTAPRYTKDIDFSTQKPLADLDFEELLQSFQKGIEGAEGERIGWLNFRLQKHEVKPARKTTHHSPSCT